MAIESKVNDQERTSGHWNFPGVSY